MPALLRDPSDSPYADLVNLLVSTARFVRDRAYAPYSHFKVGAAVLTIDRNVHSGVNVEAVDYDVTHAEESAFSAYVGSGTIMAPVMIVAVGAREDSEESVPVIPPCGKCRQKICEWVRKTQNDIDVIVADPVSGLLKLCSIRELLPLSFGG